MWQLAAVPLFGWIGVAFQGPRGSLSGLWYAELDLAVRRRRPMLTLVLFFAYTSTYSCRREKYLVSLGEVLGVVGHGVFGVPDQGGDVVARIEDFVAQELQMRILTVVNADKYQSRVSQQIDGSSRRSSAALLHHIKPRLGQDASPRSTRRLRHPTRPHGSGTTTGGRDACWQGCAELRCGCRRRLLYDLLGLALPTYQRASHRHGIAKEVPLARSDNGSILGSNGQTER